MDVLEFVNSISTSEKAVQFLQDKNILRRQRYCCRQNCTLVGDVTKTDKKVWQCKTYRKRYSVREDSFYFKSKLTLPVLVTILYLFANGSTVSQCCKFLKMKASKVSIIQWYNYYRDIMTTWLSRNPVVFNSGTVHVDETAVGGKCKYHRGHVPDVSTRWLFGIIDNVNHKVHVEFVEKRDVNCIIPIITRHVNPGCVINSDGAKVYKTLDKMNYEHHTVIHKEHFVNPIDGSHTNWIENFWSNLKSVLKSV